MSCTALANPGTTPSTTTSLPTSASPGSPTCRADGSATILGDPGASDRTRQLRRLVQQRRPRLLHRHLRQQSRQPDHDEPHRRRARSSRSCRRASRGRCCCAIRRASGRRRGSRRAPAYPMAADFNSGVSLFHPNFKTPFARSFSFGLQRTLGRQMAIEVRYVGTRLVDGTTTEEWNEVNWTTNGFLAEFKLAQANLLANIAAGRGNSFAYFGPGTGTSPLPIYLANFNGRRRAMPAMRRSTPAPTGPTPRDWRNWRAQSQPRRRGEHVVHHRRVPHEYAWRPDTRATSSCSIRPSAARRSGPTASRRPTTRCR